MQGAFFSKSFVHYHLPLSMDYSNLNQSFYLYIIDKKKLFIAYFAALCIATNPKVIAAPNQTK